MYQSNDQTDALNLFPMHLIRKDNPWVIMERLIPWGQLEVFLKELFSDSDKGRKAIPVRHILGALIIQTRMNLTDRETIDMISDMPALQYFLGLATFEPIELFDFTLLCKYRKRLGIDVTKELIEQLLKHNRVILELNPKEKDKAKDKDKNDKIRKGSLSIDATVTPVNITYPTDLKLLNATRLQSEELIDELYKASDLKTKPRTYRRLAKENYLKYAKTKKLSKGKRFTANRLQLQYIERNNIKTIEKYLEKTVFVINDIQSETLETIKAIYNQQYTMWETKTNRIDNRIVNFHQPHIRPIVRNKAGTKVEFGPKIAVSKVNGYILLDKISFDNFNESRTMHDIIERYKTMHGFYPEVIRADQIYRTQENRRLCKALNIRLSGSKLGRKPHDEEKVKADEQVQREDAKRRQEIEGVFGLAKQSYGLDKLMTKLPESQMASIGLVFFVMNLVRIFQQTSFCSRIETLILSIIDKETVNLCTGDASFA